MGMTFAPAARRKAKMRLALSGPSGSGKTYSALMIAAGLGGRIAVLDTEHGSASLYSHLTEFDTLELEAPYSPERYVEAIQAAEAAGYDTLIIDSITHEWKGSGGVLEIVEKLTQSSASKNSYTAWAKVDPRHRKFVDAMLQSKLHIIATMRSKTAYVEGERNGRKTYQKAGMAPEQRDGIEYEFTVVLDLNNEGNLGTSSKDRTGLFAGCDPFLITRDTGAHLLYWLESGAEPLPMPARTEEASAGGREPGEDDDDDGQSQGNRFSVEDAIANLQTLTSPDLIKVLRDTTKAMCEQAGDVAGYTRFVEAMKARVSSLSTTTTA